MAGQMWEIGTNTNIGQAITKKQFNDFVKLLKTEDLSYTDNKGNTYLHFLSTTRRPYYTYRMVAAGIDINVQNKCGNTALHIAALCGEPCHVPDLMACGIDPCIKNEDGKTADELSNSNIYWRDWYSKYYPGIYKCVEDNDSKRLLQLIDCWCKVDVIRNGISARKLAADQGNREMCNILDAARFTQFVIYGVLEGNIKDVKYGLERSPCDVNFLNKASLKPHILQHAIDMGAWEATRLLCEAGADVNTPVYVNNYLKGPLYFEVIKPKCELNKRLALQVLRSGIDINMRDERGRTALVYTLDKSDGDIDMDLVVHLLEYGVDIAARDTTGASARDIAKFSRRNDVVKEIDKVMIKYIRTSNMEALERLAVDAYKGFFFELNHRDTWLYAAGNETDDVLRFIEWLPSFRVKQFHRHVRNGNLKAARKELESCDRPDMLLRAKDHGGRSPLMLAVLFSQEEMVRYLISTDPSLANAKDNMQRTCMHYACSLGTEGIKMQSLLAENNGSHDSKDVLWRTPQDILAAMYGEVDESFIAEERRRVYSLKMEVSCLDKYEELCDIIGDSKCGLEQFMKALKGFRYPIAAFPVILCNESFPLLRDYKDLIFLALQVGKEDIVKRLVVLGADCIRKEMWPLKIVQSGNAANNNSCMNQSMHAQKQNVGVIQDGCQDVIQDGHQLLNAIEVVTHLNKPDLVTFMMKNKRSIDFNLTKLWL